MVFEVNFLWLTVTVSFQKKTSTSKSWIFLSIFSVNKFNNIVVTKQIYLSSAFFKSLVHISDKIEGAVGGPQNY